MQLISQHLWNAVILTCTVCIKTIYEYLATPLQWGIEPCIWRVHLGSGLVVYLGNSLFPPKLTYVGISLAPSASAVKVSRLVEQISAGVRDTRPH